MSKLMIPIDGVISAIEGRITIIRAHESKDCIEEIELRGALRELEFMLIGIRDAIADVEGQIGAQALAAGTRGEA